jgi:hypothetical protein
VLEGRGHDAGVRTSFDTVGRVVTMTSPPQFQQAGSVSGARPSTSQARQCQYATI